MSAVVIDAGGPRGSPKQNESYFRGARGPFDTTRVVVPAASEHPQNRDALCRAGREHRLTARASTRRVSSSASEYPLNGDAFCRAGRMHPLLRELRHTTHVVVPAANTR